MIVTGGTPGRRGPGSAFDGLDVVSSPASSLTHAGNTSGWGSVVVNVAAVPRGGPCSAGPYAASLNTGGVFPIAASLNGSTS